MTTAVDRQTVDLSGYPDLVVIYLGMRVRKLFGLKMLMGIGPGLEKAGAARPDGLLHYENGMIYSFKPLHVGMRWYWRDFESMERWARSEPHRKWWQDFLRDSGGTGFWHETYFMRGGIEAIYDDISPARVGLQAFAPGVPARGRMFAARTRIGPSTSQKPLDPPNGMSESDLYKPEA